MMDLRKRLFIGISLVVGLVLVILLWYLFIPAGVKHQAVQILTPNREASKTNLPVTGSGEDNLGQGETTIPEVYIPPEFSQEIYAKQVARLFVERFASYSNQNDNTHINDALVLATKTMAKWLRTQKLVPSQQYEGVTTKVMASSIDKITETEAVVLVDTQQQIKKDQQTDIKQRSGRVELIKVGEDWKVDGFFWND